jgi:5,10-methenyltetrahydromethanopterin hydrogenase
MSSVYICTGCYRTHGHAGEANFCSECQSYKYFDWVDEGDEE